MPILVQGMAKLTGDRFLIKSNAGYVACGFLGLHHAKSTTFFSQTGQLVKKISRFLIRRLDCDDFTAVYQRAVGFFEELSIFHRCAVP